MADPSGSTPQSGAVHNHSDGNSSQDFMHELPRLVAQLADRWYTIRQRGCRHVDLGEMRPLTRVIASGLAGTPLKECLNTARRIDERVAQHLQSPLPPTRNEQETIGALILRLQASLPEDLAGSDGVPVESEAGDARTPVPDRLKVQLLGPAGVARDELALQLAASGFHVDTFANLQEAADSSPAVTPHSRVVLADPPGPSVPDDAIRLPNILVLQDTGDGEHSTTADDWDAVLTMPTIPSELAATLEGLVDSSPWDPWRVMLVTTGQSTSLARALQESPALGIQSVAPEEDVPGHALESLPEVIVIDADIAADKAAALSRALAQDPTLFDIPRVLLAAHEDAALEPPEAAPEQVSGEARLCRRRRRAARAPATLQSRDLTPLLDHWRAELATEPGIVALACVEWDEASSLIRDHGAAGFTVLQRRLLGRISASLVPGERTTRFSENTILVLLHRADTDALSDWGDALYARIPALHGAASHAPSSGVSIGITALAETPAPDAVDRSLALCAQARSEGGNRIQLDPTLNTPECGNAQEDWREVITGAIQEQRLFLVYQPIANIAGSDNAERYEVLLRIRDPEGHTQLPGPFVNMAGYVDLDRALDRWVLANAVDILGARLRTHPDSVFFVKLSRGSLRDQELPAWLGRTLAHAGLPARALVLQLAEEDIVAEPEQAERMTEALRDLQVGIAVEHFGLSSEQPAQLLRSLRPDYVKVARPLTHGLHDAADKLTRLETLLNTARDSGARTIAAYVEDVDGLALLWQSQVDLVQGNFLRQPDEELRYDIEF
ncbi:EAL domain-containing protein (putative c-di-GMP-specific phosphodiesterase class I) [Thioalkalivibrio sp. ALE21]|nr:EAL domain-containing protein (putative c-di-GMP-specific phosphodiesterase class I) [Thioalkalivibrio sp. ALE21]